jgi:putative ABC transport system permease protein
MSLWTLLIREIAYRRFHFLAGVLVVMVATACVAAVFTLLRAHSLCMESINNEQTRDAESAMADLHEDYRLITRNMGYNVLILSKEQDIAAYLSEGIPSTTLPEADISTLAKSPIITLQHLLPALLLKIEWPEQNNMRVNLCGIRAEVEHKKSNKKDPMMDSMPTGAVRVGYVLVNRLNLKKGDTVTMLGRPFTVSETLDERGSNEDITLWFNLDDLQEMTGHKGEVSMIYALSCTCTGSELLRIRKEIGSILPDTQVIQLAAQATARARTRERAKSLDASTMEQLAIHHAQLAQEREALARWLLPAVIAAAMAMLSYLSWSNASARINEIGVWRALGMSTPRLLSLFLFKALIVGFAGGILGLCAGISLGGYWGLREIGDLCGGVLPSEVISIKLMVAVLVAAPGLALFSAWLPALVAARKDPATILRED